MQKADLYQLFNQFSDWLNLNQTYTFPTIYIYKQIIHNFINYLINFNISSLVDMSDNHIYQFLHWRGDKAYTLASIRSRTSAVDLFLSWAYEQRLYHSQGLLNYHKNFKNYQPLQERRAGEGNALLNKNFQILNEHEVKILLNYFNSLSDLAGVRDACMMILVLEHGLFLDEIRMLSHNDLSIAENMLIIRGIRSREIFLSTLAIKWLNQWIEEKNKVDANLLLDDPLFITSRFKPMNRRIFHYQVTARMQAAGIVKKEYGIELLRRTAVMHMLQKGLPVHQIQKILGFKHASTLEKYIKAINN